MKLALSSGSDQVKHTIGEDGVELVVVQTIERNARMAHRSIEVVSGDVMRVGPLTVLEV
jgi:hypothetical protein